MTSAIIDGPLPDALADRVQDLARRATEPDGVGPLDEDATLALRTAHEPPRVHVVADGSGSAEVPGTVIGPVVGYAQADPASGAITLVVDPAYRRQGLGSALLAHAASSLRPGVAPSGWAHGDLPAAAAFAARHGFSPVRTLWQMRRSLVEPVPEVPLPAGFRLRAFVPGADDAAWLELNARAFSELPEQGGLTLSDLRARIAEPWFDAEGFLVAEAVPTPSTGPELAAFHWTKVHPRTEDDPSPSGEVYVLGVDPRRQGNRLGAAMLAAGLEHLRDRGLTRVLLYVDAANTPAVRLYQRLGFTTWRADVRYAAARDSLAFTDK